MWRRRRSTIKGLSNFNYSKLLPYNHSSTTYNHHNINDIIRPFLSHSSSTSVAASAALPSDEIAGLVDVSRHYGRCYYELSKTLLRMLVVATSGTGYILGTYWVVELGLPSIFLDFALPVPVL